jgi:hypothetical protein
MAAPAHGVIRPAASAGLSLPPEDLGAQRDERRLLLEQMHALHDLMRLLDERSYAVRARLYGVMGWLSMTLLQDQHDPARQMVDVLQEQQELLGRKQDLHHRQFARLGTTGEQGKPAGGKRHVCHAQAAHAVESNTPWYVGGTASSGRLGRHIDEPMSLIGRS